jgi:aspartate racemase
MLTRTLGLVVGLGMRAGIYYYEKLSEAFEQTERPPRLFMAHADVRTSMGYVTAGKTHELAVYLSSLVHGLAKAGADLVAISAVTPHISFDEICAASPVPMISVLQAVNDDLHARGMQRVAVFGTRYTIESSLFGAITNAQVLRPSSHELETIHRIYTDYAVTGIEKEGQREELERVADALIRRERLDAIVLAGTDLSPFYEGNPPAYPVIDASTAHITAIVNALSVAKTADPGRSGI